MYVCNICIIYKIIFIKFTIVTNLLNEVNALNY